MARRILDLKGYTLNPATRVITYPGIIKQEQLILITNVTAGQVIYNFSDPSLKATTYNTSILGATGTTTITLNFNTAAMGANDKLQFIIDQVDETMDASEVLKDPVNKFRVSQAQALIDTDFEYGSQQTKWENLAMINNRPFAYPSASAIAISTITMSIAGLRSGNSGNYACLVTLWSENNDAAKTIMTNIISISVNSNAT
jgi:hypothetical protein